MRVGGLVGAALSHAVHLTGDEQLTREQQNAIGQHLEAVASWFLEPENKGKGRAYTAREGKPDG